MLSIEMTDFAGNLGVQTYYIYVVNPLQYTEVTVGSYQSGILDLNFSSTLKVSGTLVLEDFIVFIDRPDSSFASGYEFNYINNTKYEILSFAGNVISLKIFDTNNIPFVFMAGDEVRVQITNAGVARLFNTLDQPIIQTANNTRSLINDWPSVFTFAGILDSSGNAILVNDIVSSGNSDITDLLNSRQSLLYINEIPFTQEQLDDNSTGLNVGFVPFKLTSGVDSLSGIVPIGNTIYYVKPSPTNFAYPLGGDLNTFTASVEVKDDFLFITIDNHSFLSKNQNRYTFRIEFKDGTSTLLTYRRYTSLENGVYINLVQ